MLLNTNEHKASGPDEISGKLLKTVGSEISEIYTFLFQTSLNQGKIPNDWKRAKIMPIFKKGDKSKPENYRPISLTSISCKLLEHIIYSNIINHLEKHKVLNDIQHGFRHRRSCESQLISVTNDFSNCLNNRSQIDSILLDFSKAFDKVDHKGLLMKLKHYGISGNLLEWIRSFLLNRQQTVLVDGKESKELSVLSGVPQGTVLGPLFFLIYINDINENLTPGTNLRLFADDSFLYREIRTTNDCRILQKDLNSLQNWELKWKMEFRPSKCQFLRITNKKRPIKSDYNIHQTKVIETDNSKYLGVIIDSKLNWKEQIKAVCKKSNAVLAFLKRNLLNSPRYIKECAFKALVKPILEYGGCVWDPHLKVQVEELERVHKNAARYVTNNYSFIGGSTVINMKKLNWMPLEEYRARKKITTFYKGLNKLIEIPIHQYARIHDHRKTIQSENQGYDIPTSIVNSHLHSFFPNTIRL